MNPDNLLPTVTAIIKYDLFPYYVVAKGNLRQDGGIQTGVTSYYRPEGVLKVLPESEYEVQKANRSAIEQDYRERERELRVDILIENDVDFVTVK